MKRLSSSRGGGSRGTEPAIFDASAGDGDEWAERALSGKHKGPLSVADAQEQLGLAAHPSMGEVGGGATIRAANFRVSQATQATL